MALQVQFSCVLLLILTAGKAFRFDFLSAAIPRRSALCIPSYKVVHTFGCRSTKCSQLHLSVDCSSQMEFTHFHDHLHLTQLRNPAPELAQKPNYIPKQKMIIVLDESDLDERFVRCTGNGGQKVNKSSSKVDLVHKPTGLKVSCQDFRDLSSNRARARKLLTAKLDLHFNGKASKIGMKQDLLRKRKKNAVRYVQSVVLQFLLWLSYSLV